MDGLYLLGFGPRAPAAARDLMSKLYPELAGAGACQLASYRDDLTSLFKPGEEILVYRDLGDLRRHLDYYLARPDEARAIGENARRRALAEHTLRHRIEEMREAVETTFGKRS